MNPDYNGTCTACNTKMVPNTNRTVCSESNCQSLCTYYYRPHPKDDGRLYFQSVHTCGGVPHLRSRWGGYPIPGLGRVGQSSTASTCYAEGGVPLAFTQEDYLVLKLNLTNLFVLLINNRTALSSWRGTDRGHLHCLPIWILQESSWE